MTEFFRFIDRVDAGEKLAEKLMCYKDDAPIVYALPRGGVPVGAIVAGRLGAFLDLVIPRKIGHPLNPEYAVCAVSEHGQLVCNPAEEAALDKKWLKTQVQTELAEAKRRRRVYLGSIKTPDPMGRVAIIVDDGIATGLTMQAAILDVKSRRPEKVVVAVPVLPFDTYKTLSKEIKVVCLLAPKQFLGAVGTYYYQFEQVTDEEVIKALSH